MPNINLYGIIDYRICTISYSLCVPFLCSWRRNFIFVLVSGWSIACGFVCSVTVERESSSYLAGEEEGVEYLGLLPSNLLSSLVYSRYYSHSSSLLLLSQLLDDFSLEKNLSPGLLWLGLMALVQSATFSAL